MFKFYRNALATGAIALGLAACGDKVNVVGPPTGSRTVTSVVVTPTNATVGIGQTINLAASVSADSGISTALTWTTSNAAIATVSSTGAVTGVAIGTTTVIATSVFNPAKSAAVSITVSSNAAFSVSPTAMTLAPGQSSAGAAQIVLQGGQTASVVQWTSLSPSIATVSTSTTACGTLATNNVCITGVSQGTAVVTASDSIGGVAFSSTIAVTVGQGASISIQSINTGATAGTVLSPNPNCVGVAGAPVILTDVNCQIDVVLNLTAGVQRLDSLVIYLKRGGTFFTAAKQVYGGTIPSSGAVTLSVNTANFVPQPNGTARVDWVNGPTTLVSQVFPTVGPGGAVFNCQIGANDPTCAVVNAMVLNNTDGWAANLSKPLRSATDVGGSGFNTGKTYWGGPSDSGTATANLYAVVYNDNPANTPGSQLNRCSNQLGDGTGCISNVTWTLGSSSVPFGHCPDSTQTALPFTQVFGTASTSTHVTNDCTGHQNILARRDNILIMTAQDAQSNSYPTGGLIANTTVFGATPDSLRLDWAGPNVTTPSLNRNAPAVTGWVNASYNFVNTVNISDAGVGPVPSSAATQYSSVNCPGVTASNAPMPTGTGADINGGVACPTNFIGGQVGISGSSAPWTVQATGTDLLGNASTSGTSNTFGTDYTAPAIRWGLVDAVFPLPAAYGGSVTDPVDSTRFQTAVVKAAGVFGEFRAEYLDERSGFYSMGQPNGGAAAQSQTLATAGHLNPVGVCLIGTGGPGATFVTNPGCGFTPITVGTPGVRLDGWQPGQRLNVPLPEGYYGYQTWVEDEAGNVSPTIFRSVLINNQSPFSTGLGVPAILTSTNFNFIATFSDSAEVVDQSLQVSYPVTGTVFDSLRYAQSPIGLAFDNVITSPFSGNIAPPTGAPYAHSIEQTTGAAFPASNVNAAGVQVKPTSVKTWSWNPGSLFSPGGPLPGVSPVIPIPGLNVENNNNINTFNGNNPTIAITNFRIIATVSTANQFGSTVALRGQVSSPSNAPNPPFARVDFYRQVGGLYSSYLGSVSGSAIQLSAACSSSVAEVCGTDQGTYRSWVYQLPSFLNRWDGATQAAVASGDNIIAVGVVSTGDALMTQVTTMTP